MHVANNLIRSNIKLITRELAKLFHNLIKSYIENYIELFIGDIDNTL